MTRDGQRKRKHPPSGIGSLNVNNIFGDDPPAIPLKKTRKATAPRALDEFLAIYKAEYEQEMLQCKHWIAWCRKYKDEHGVNFHQGRESALIFHDIMMHQLIRSLKQESPEGWHPPAIRVGEFKLFQKLNGNLWLENGDREGMELEQSKLEPTLRRFFKENF